jgi:hypothetical protein
MVCFFQVKCWQIRRLTKAPQAAGAIHTDFEKGFICAEVSSLILNISWFLIFHILPPIGLNYLALWHMHIDYTIKSLAKALLYHHLFLINKHRNPQIRTRYFLHDSSQAVSPLQYELLMDKDLIETFFLKNAFLFHDTIYTVTHWGLFYNHPNSNSA